MAPPDLKPLQKRLLSENVVGEIRKAIYKGDLELGQRLVETELAERLGVSRGPVREALRLLAAEGLAVINAHRGTFVVQPTVEDVEEIYTLRESLETLALRRVVEIASDEETRALDEKVERMRAALQEGETDRVLALDMEFHGLLFHLARHERLSRVWVKLESQHRLFNALYAKTLTPETVRENLSHGVEEHTQITRAVKNRDAQTACGLLSQHVKRFAELAQRALRALYSGEIPSRDA